MSDIHSLDHLQRPVSQCIPSTSVAPLVDRILSNPLTFVPARQKDKLANVRPTNYIVLTDQVSENFLKLQEQQILAQREEAVLKQQQIAEDEMKRPKSMLEAVTAYTNKRFLSKAELKAGKQKQQDEKMQEDLGKDLDEARNVAEASENSSEKETEPESSPVESEASEPESETPNDNQSDSDETGSERFVDAVDRVDDTSEEDVDYNSDVAAAAEEESESESEDGEEDSQSEDEGVEVPQPGEDGVMKVSEINDTERRATPSGETSDASDISEASAKARAETPPTSPEDDTKHIIANSLAEFQGINENSEDRGSNGSTRIYKNWREIKGKPVGLLNHGVTCYMNSAVQAMIHIPAVQHYLNDVHAGKYNAVLKSRSVSHVMADLAHRMWNDAKPTKYVNPKKLIGRLDDINCMMSAWQQEDSHEYFMSLLSRLQEDSTPSGTKLNESIIYDIFGGLLDQTVVCKSCHAKSETQQEFYDLSLGLDSKKKKAALLQEPDALGNTVVLEEAPAHRYSLENSIKDFFSQEIIRKDKKDANSGYDCDACKQKTAALKQSKINRAPEALAVHLKRFRFNGSSGSKVKHPVSYPNILDLTEYTSGNEPVKYQLISVIVHAGRSVSSGHYIAHARQPDGTWNTYDDEYLNKISEKQALRDPAAYYLVYTRLTHKTASLPPPSAKRSGSKTGNKRKMRRV
ncbi:hypothetical protein BABINDRAFT_13874 [Babjeviella inositovora NRRL Y-12698]|uniref:ubiquitinyl hydrolase 1 n=1 Tax=Babjeviella inositovora NRRL Y-12698 TaxID=984486 RepID=A0A1E3QPC6_9ASCO|nr:uncharacterized protein BABINDRAFT_13874 [Babjeviella inositovora NRRL Y-12698]ODQ79559.1 hypothetical protein BABINDRAFT_13874 [Babjeviella inositovora NRRL Y-12698]